VREIISNIYNQEDSNICNIDRVLANPQKKNKTITKLAKDINTNSQNKNN
jgi:hypothetical protein